MAANLNEVFSAELAEVMNSVEFKNWLVSEFKNSLFPNVEAVEKFLEEALKDPIACGFCNPSYTDYRLSKGRERTRSTLQSWAKRFIFINNK